MPLVDYESSGDESDGGSEKEEEIVTPKKQAKPGPDLNSKNGDENATIFSALPKPRANVSFLGDDNKLSKLLLNKKSNSGEKPEKESIKISVPSVSEFEEDQPAAKKLKPSAKGVGLFSVLPPPKNQSIKETTRTFVPHSVGKNQVKNLNKNLIQKSEKSTIEKETNEEDDEDASVGSSFFGSGLSEPSSSTEPEPEPVPEINNESAVCEEPLTTVSQDVSNSYAYMQPMPEPMYSNQNNIQEQYLYSSSAPIGPELPLAEDNPLELDEKALQILCGNKKKRQHMPMNIIDLSGEEIMPDSKEWLLKQFTEEKKVRSHSHKKGTGPSSQQRRKHQITYLAYQAKAQELELQNQWAQNRMSRKQTQSKYGF